MIVDSHSILVRWRNHFSLLQNVHGVNDVRQTEIHTAEPLMLETSAFEFDLAIEKLKSHKSAGTDQIPSELRQGVERFVMKSINFLWAGHVARMEKRRGVFRVLVRKPEGKRPLGNQGVGGRIILRWIFRKWDVGVWTGSSWLRIGTGGGHL